jgi:heme/copper-type cytochrome/quinol oxidase subunit 2
MDKLLFQEQQYMMGNLFMSGIIVLVLLVGFIQYRRFRKSNATGKLYARTILIFIIVFSVFILPVMATLHLDTRYYTNRVEYRFASVLSPLFQTRYDVVSLDSVTRVAIITYDPDDYGGWGMKGNEHTVACNATGNRGVLFTFKRGKQLLLGASATDTLQQLLPAYYPF